MDQEKSKIPSWLQDKKKLLIIILVVISMVISSANSAIIGNKLVSKASDKLNEYGIHLEIKDIIKANIDQLLGKGLNGEYHNDYADEILTFKRNGELIYYAGGYEMAGTYTIEKNVLTMFINFMPYEFDILQNNGQTLVLSTGDGMFSYTKVK